MARTSSSVHPQGTDRIVTLGTGTTNLTPELHANRLLTLETAGSLYTLNLPRAYGTGDTYEFLSTAARTSNVVINAVAGVPSNKFIGRIFLMSTSANVFTSFASTADDIITLNQTTSGGVLAGDYLLIVDAAPAVWRIVRSMLTVTGNQITPFSGA